MSLSTLQFHQASVNALADVLDDGRHFVRLLSFADGHRKILGILLGDDDNDAGKVFKLSFVGQSSERLEVIYGEFLATIDDEEPQQVRAGQSFVVAGGASVCLRPAGIVQYIRHLEG